MSHVKSDFRHYFIGHLKVDDAQLAELWKTAVIALDANVLLNFYRYSDPARDELMGLLGKLGDRLWVPHQSCVEFFNNRLGVILEQERAYAAALSEMRGLDQKFKSERAHPFLSPELQTKLDATFTEVSAHLELAGKNYSELVSEDTILGQIEDLLSKRVGKPMAQDKISDICAQGEARYKKRIPPGFKDSEKIEAADSHRRFGDLFVWKQLMERAKEVKQPIIFITDDRKEDWWLMAGSKTVGPRPELISEFYAETGLSFLMYKPHRFLEHARTLLGQKVNPKTIQEAKDRRVETVSNQLELRRNRHERDIAVIQAQLQSLDRDRMNVEQRLAAVEIDSPNDPMQLSFAKQLQARLSAVNQQISMLDRLLAAAKNDYVSDVAQIPIKFADTDEEVPF